MLRALDGSVLKLFAWARAVLVRYRLPLAVVATVLIGSAHSCKLKATNVILRVSTDVVRAKLTSRWDWPGRLPAQGQVMLEGATSLETGLLAPIVARHADAWMVVD